MRFRERHQDPKATDIEYAARINGYASVDDFIDAHSPARRGSSRWSASSPACRSSTRWSSASGRSRCRNICGRAPTRRSSPSAIGGCFGCIYSVRGAGGYQMFGITPMPIYDPNQEISYLRDFMVFFRPGDIVKWKPIDRAAYDATVEDVEAGRFAPLDPRRHLRPRRVQRGHRRLQPQARWRCSMAIKVIAPGPLDHRPGPRPSRLLPSRHPALRRDGPLRARAPPTCSSATTKARPASRPCSWGRSSSSRADATVAVTGADAAAEGRRRAARDLDVLRGQERARCSPSIS